VRVVIDHLAGTRRGQRQEFPAQERVRFGRHPECEVSFDAHRDIDNPQLQLFAFNRFRSVQSRK